MILYDAFAWILAFFYQLVPSYGFAIVGLTLVVMIAVTPLTLKGTRSMMVMQKLQPEIRKIQSRHKDDRQTLNEELMKFYNENNINPLGGCLPLLVQMPVFLFLYQVLRGLTLRDPTMGTNVGWVSGQLGIGQSPTTPPDLHSFETFDPAYLDESTKLYQDLHQTTTMQFAGMDLAVSASEALKGGIVNALPYLLLVAVVAASGWAQQRQIQARTSSTRKDEPPNPQTQMLKYTWLMLPVFSFVLPAGLVLYFVVSNLYRVGLQYFISRSIYGVGKDGEDEGKTASARRRRTEDEELAPVGARSSNGSKKAASKDEPDGKAASRSKAGSGAGKSGKETGSGSPRAGSRGSGRTTPRGGRTAGGKTDERQKAGGRSGRGSGEKSAGKSVAKSEDSSEPTLQPRARKRKR